jgi:ParB family chromosome partitioning protein
MSLQGKYQEALATIERLTKEGGVPLELPISRLVRVPGRQRPLTQEERADLKANLKANPLVHPITVLPETEGGFEVLSGHNRVDIYEELGRTTIRAIVIDVPRETVDALAFYANLLAPSLPDFKKFEGLKARKEQTGFTIEQLAEDSGVSKSTISRLFQFEDLPAGAHAILQKNPFILGASAAVGLAHAARAGRGDLVVEAVQMLADAAANPGAKEARFTEEKAVAHANGVKQTIARPVAPPPLVVKQGKRNFAKVQVRGDQVTVKFADPSVSASDWAAKFEALLKAEIAKAAAE